MTQKPARSAFWLVGVLALSTISLGGVHPATAATCEVTKSLSQASVATDSLDFGGSLTRYSFSAGQANSAPYATRFTVSKTNLNYTTLVPTNAKYLRDDPQLTLARNVDALVHVNGDFFDFNSRMPYSAIARGSKLSYSPQGKSRVLGIRNLAASAKTGILANSVVKSGSKSFTISGLNLPLLTGSKIVAYSSAYQSALLPTAAASILVVGGKVTKIYATGSQTRPKTGYLFSAVGAQAAALKAVKIGSSFSYKMPAAKLPTLSRDGLVSAGTITDTSGAVLATISAVNFWATSYASGVVVFDDSYDATPPRGAATAVIGSNGIITRVSSSGASVAIPSGGTVVQFYGTTQSKIGGFTQGATVSVKRNFKTTSGNTYENLFGVGVTLISKGSVVAPCTGNSDSVRPRTAVGWDDFGNVYLATTTMGRDWLDGGQGGYRVGGSTVHQMADWLHDVGATNAVSLDGGGSTTMYAKLSGTYHRVDLPDGVWVRPIPVGVALTSR